MFRTGFPAAPALVHEFSIPEHQKVGLENLSLLRPHFPGSPLGQFPDFVLGGLHRRFQPTPLRVDIVVPDRVPGDGGSLIVDIEEGFSDRDAWRG
jgi:hypothetical protein